MQEPTYREALRAAWQITWSHKFLLVFGLFATFVGQFGILELVTKMGFAGTKYAYTPLWVFGGGEAGISTLFSAGLGFQTWLLLFWIFVIIAGFFVLLTLMAVASHGALIHATGQYSNHPKKHVNIDDAWHAGVSHFWRLFGIITAKAAVLFVLAIAVGTAVLRGIYYTGFFDAVLFVALFAVAMVVGMIVSFVAVYAAGYVVIEEYSLKQSIASAWVLFKEHWLVSIEIGLTVLVANILISLIALASVYIFLLPTLLLWLAASGVVQSILLFNIGTVLAFGLFVLFIALLGSLLTVFTTSLWMYLFQHMHRRGMVSRTFQFFS